MMTPTRSGYERGFEHFNNLTRLSNKSVLLKHMLSKHENMGISQVRWDMFIDCYEKTAFERQLEEAVSIARPGKTRQGGIFYENHVNLSQRLERNFSPKVMHKLFNRQHFIGILKKHWSKSGNSSLTYQKMETFPKYFIWE